MPENILTVVGITILFLGLAIQPSIATVQTEKEIDVEPKDYLFQTIIDIANHPDIKELLEQYDNDLFKVDIDRTVYRKLLLKNPRLLFNILFTKPSISIHYLNKCYNNGIEITDIIGEDKVIETVENVDFTDTKFFDKLNNIVTKDEEISNRLVELNSINKALVTINDLDDNPLFCFILLMLIFVLGLISVPISLMLNFLEFIGLELFLYNFLAIIELITILFIMAIFLMMLAFCYMELPIL